MIILPQLISLSVKHYLLYTFKSSSPRNCSRSPTVQASIQKRWAPGLPRSFRNCFITKQSAQYVSFSSSISFITVTLSKSNSRSFHAQISLLTIMKWTFWTSNYFVYPYLTSFSWCPNTRWKKLKPPADVTESERSSHRMLA